MRLVSVTDITCAVGAGATPGQVAASKVFRDWLTRTRVGGIRVESVHVLAAHRYLDSPDIRMIHLKATAYRGNEADVLPGVSFLRGDAVDIFTLLQTPDGQRYVVLVDQPRVPGAQACVRSNPSGMVEGETVKFAGLREVREEIGDDTLTWRCPFDANCGTVHDMLADTLSTDLPNLVSPGGSDERVSHLVTMAEVTQGAIDRLQRRHRSVEGEDITVVVFPLRELLQHLVPPGGAADEKTLVGALLYQMCLGEQVYDI